MITAKEAQELVKCSDLMVNRFLDVIGPAIREAATAGKTSLIASTIVTAPSHDVLSVHAETFKVPELTGLQKRIIDSLKGKGFGAQFEKHGDPYVPRSKQTGYDDEDARQTHYQHWTLVVRWSA